MSNILKMLAGSGGYPTGDIAEAVDLDGTNDYFSRASDFTGNADGKTFTFSAWFWRNLLSTTVYYNGNNCYINVNAAGNFATVTLNFRSAAPANILQASTSAIQFPLNTWCHVLVSIDLANTANRGIYINDVDVTSTVTWSTYSNAAIDFTSIDHRVGGGTDFAKGRLSNVFLDYQYRDLSIEANRRLFIVPSSS